MNTIGIGLRRELADELIDSPSSTFDFVELAPENWMSIGGYWREKLEEISSKYPINAHGLSLSIGSPDALDRGALKKIRTFLEEFKISIYSEHLSFSKANNAHLYDLLPIPFTKDAVNHVVERIKYVQDFLGRQLILENVSYYATLDVEIPEVEFISSIVEKSGCGVLLDVNNVFVNSFNHGYNPKAFIDAMPLHAVKYIHIAGHHQVSDDLIIDTHGADIIDPVFDLLNYVSGKMEAVPVLLERDFNIPALPELETERIKIKTAIQENWSNEQPAIA